MLLLLIVKMPHLTRKVTDFSTFSLCLYKLHMHTIHCAYDQCVANICCSSSVQECVKNRRNTVYNWSIITTKSNLHILIHYKNNIQNALNALINKWRSYIVYVKSPGPVSLEALVLFGAPPTRGLGAQGSCAADPSAAFFETQISDVTPGICWNLSNLGLTALTGQMSVTPHVPFT